VTNLIKARDVQVFWVFPWAQANGHTPIPAHVWTDYLKKNTLNLSRQVHQEIWSLDSFVRTRLWATGYVLGKSLLQT